MEDYGIPLPVAQRRLPKPVSWGIGDVAKGLAIVAVAAGVLLSALASLIRFVGGTHGPMVALLATGAIELLMLSVAVWFAVRGAGGEWQALGFRAVSRWADLLLAGAVLLTGFAISGAYMLVVDWLGWQFLQPPPIPSIFTQGGAVSWGGGVLALFIAPVTEEAFFRGFVFAGIAGRFGFWAGAAASAAAFTLGHLEPSVMVPIFALGVLLAWLYHRTSSLWPSIAVHMTYNAFALLGVG